MIRRPYLVRTGSTQQSPIRPKVVYWSARRGDWWPGLDRRCTHCGGNLWVTPPDTAPGHISCLLCEREVCEVLPGRPSTIRTPEEWAALPDPRRGRPASPGRPKRSQPATVEPEPPKALPNQPRLCADCGVRKAGWSRTRCRSCGYLSASTDLNTTGLVSRFLAVLRCSNSLRTREIAAILGCQPGALRHVAAAARAKGVPVVSVGKRYQIGGEP